MKAYALSESFFSAFLFAQTIPYCMTKEEKRRRILALLCMIKSAQGGSHGR